MRENYVPNTASFFFFETSSFFEKSSIFLGGILRNNNDILYHLAALYQFSYINIQLDQYPLKLTTFGTIFAHPSK